MQSIFPNIFLVGFIPKSNPHINIYTMGQFQFNTFLEALIYKYQLETKNGNKYKYDVFKVQKVTA